MKTYAVFRGLYGSDFATHAIESVLPFVDKAILVWGIVPFAGVTEWTHKGKRYVFPDRFDDLPEKVAAMDDPRVHVVNYHSPNPRNQWTEIVNDIVIPQFGKPDVVILGHVPHVWCADALKANLEEFEVSRYRCANTFQIETWRGLDWRLPERHRAGVGFWNIRDAGKMPETWLDFNPRTTPLARVPMLGGRVHSLRNSQNPNIMFWRHLVVQAYVSKLGDSKPNPDHFEEKILNWTPATRDLEMALAWKHTVPKAVPYNTDELPEVIRRDLVDLQRKTSNATWKGYPKCDER